MDFEKFISIVNETFPKIEDSQISQFRDMQALYEDWNSKINVISRKDISNLYDHHILHSLAIAKYLLDKQPDTYKVWSENGVSILDLGCGGGFPGIPLAVLFPTANFVLCDSVRKKTIVAQEVASSLKLQNVKIENDRVENLKTNFDYVVSRAVATLDTIYPWVKGRFSNSIITLKGGDINEEIYNFQNKFNIQKNNIHTWQIDSWLNDEYYAEKFVIEVER